ncbi:hypothetical protein KBB96_09945 [Luteolibacter ambystomatis]|uniref:Transposase n=1 Tax=Luteolibacter ambystomatis TaxID=2824561 RepID=A0A975PHC9_9BACT|nr:hypothetical protein [Luteolibacter ambystomatis]QUE53202.1 hypothetical protein KBB96_09945 [Luteolibacter ambystomatis]
MTSIVDPGGGPGLIRSDSRGRVLIEPTQREALLDAFERGGQSAMAFRRQHGLKYPTFATWVQKRRRDRLEPEPVQHSFAEVVVDAPMEPSVQAAVAEPLRVTLADGTRIEVASRKHLAWVAELLRHLTSTRPC